MLKLVSYAMISSLEPQDGQCLIESQGKKVMGVSHFPAMSDT